MPKTAKAVSEKSTKQEILDAYKEILQEVGSVTATPESQADQKVVSDATKETVEKIVTDLSQLKLNLNKTITDVTDKLTSEAERLTTLRKAIAISQKELEETEQVKVRLGMLKRLIELHAQKETELEKEMTQTRNTWEEEKQNYEATVKLERSRQEEEYKYEQELLKKRAADEREEEKLQQARHAALDKENTEKLLAELADLRKKVTLYPVELNRVVKEAVGKAVFETKKEADIEKRLAQQAAAAELNLAKLQIQTFESTTKLQLTEIERLKRELTYATQQVKDVAVAVIEGRKVEATPATPKSSEEQPKK